MSVDVGGMLAGVVFVLLGTLFLLAELEMLTLRADLVLPGVMVALGAAMVLGALFRRR